jgi:hypothetical protein
MIETRVSCFDCTLLRRCNAPSRAEPDLLRRCEDYTPKPGVADQRTGRERYPTLVAEARERGR